MGKIPHITHARSLAPVFCLSCCNTPYHLTHQRRKRILFPAKEAQSQSRSAESTRKIDSSSHETQAARGPLCLPARQLPFAPRPSGTLRHSGSRRLASRLFAPHYRLRDRITASSSRRGVPLGPSLRSTDQQKASQRHWYTWPPATRILRSCQPSTSSVP